MHGSNLKFPNYYGRANTQWILTWQMVGGKKAVKTRLVATGYRELDLEEGSVDAPGRVSLHSPRL